MTDAAPTFRKDMRSDEWTGIFIDIGRALAEDMGVELEIVTTTWGNSVLDLQAGKIDLMFGLNPTPERRKAIDFSDARLQQCLHADLPRRRHLRDLGSVQPPGDPDRRRRGVLA